MDNSIRLISSDGAKALETARGHCAPVTCLALSPDSNYLVTGSRDTTVLLWRIHRASISRANSISEPPSASGTPTSTSSNTLANILADKSRRRRIEGPMHILRGHFREIVCCCVSSDLGIVVSCSQSSDVLLHSVRNGRLIRRLVGVEAHAICLSPEGIIMTWNKISRNLSTFTLNGILISSAQLPFSSSISCMEISVNGKNALIGVNSCSENEAACAHSSDVRFNKPENEYFDAESDETRKNYILDISTPSICFLNLHTLEVINQK